MNPIKRTLRLLYEGGMWLDRKNREGGGLRRPIVSVGNIAFGGRAKTPFVIYLAQGLKSRGYEPVILTRGYGRKSTKDVMLYPKRLEMLDLKPTEKFVVDESGDEALEIFLRSDCPVLVSKHRKKFAKSFLKMAPPLRWIFILDDGFQHWDLERDFDLVLVTREDLSGEVFPEGHLRESVRSLDRADLVFEKDSDFTKVIKIVSHPPLGEMMGVLTTRAGSQKEYKSFFVEQFDRVHFVELADHAPTPKMISAILKSKVKYWILGLKEAVKVLNEAQLKDFISEGKVRIHQGPFKGVTFFFCDLELQIRDENTLWSKILEKVRVSELVS